MDYVLFNHVPLPPLLHQPHCLNLRQLEMVVVESPKIQQAASVANPMEDRQIK